LAYGSVTDPVPEERLVEMLNLLSIKPGGLAIAIDILHMHIYSELKPVGPELTACARTLIARAPLERDDHGLDHALGQLIKRFLAGPEAEIATRRLLERICEAIDSYAVSRYDFNETLKALFAEQPTLALNALIGDENLDEAEDQSVGYIRRDALAGGRRSGALLSISEEALLDWCRTGSGPERWLRIAPLLPAFDSPAADAPLEWSSKVKVLLANAPDPAAVAETLIDVLIPTGWSGSRADAIRQRLPLLDQLGEILGPDHERQVANWRRNVMERIDREARRELENHRWRNERFE